MQFSGSLSQFVLQRNLSQVNQPMGGVKASPLSRPFIPVTAHHNATMTAPQVI